MKKLKSFVLSVLLLSAFASSAVACGGEKLNKPVGLNVDENNRISWFAVEDAKNYVIRIKDANTGKTVKEQKSSRTYYPWDTLPEGDYEIRIKAVGADAQSSWSAVLEFHKAFDTGCVYTLINNKSEYEISYGGTASGELEIEDEYRGKPLTRIADGAFRANTRITSVKVGKNVTEIGENAFYNCSKLTKVTLPDGLKTLGQYAFSFCGALESVNIPDKVETVGMQTFSYCRALKELEIGESVTEIGELAFAHCSGLEELVLPDSVKTIGKQAFENMSALKKVTFGNGLETVGYAAFQLDGALENIEFAEESSLTLIDDYAFLDCDSLTEMDIPEGVTEIGYRAFNNTDRLASVSLPDSLTRLSAEAFEDSKLHYDAVQAGAKLFYVDDWLADVTEDYEKKIDNVYRNDLYENPDGLWGNADDTKIDTVKSGIRGIGDNAFIGCSELRTVEIPNSVKIVGQYAFNNCKKLRKVKTYANTAEIIGDGAFSGCEELLEIDFGYGLKKIGSYAFLDCILLKNKDQGDGSLDASLVPSSVTSIGTEAFKGTALWDEKRDDGIIYAGTWVVGVSNSAIGQAQLHEESRGIADYAFYRCTALRNVEGLSRIRNIGRGAFYECGSLEKVVLSGNLRRIEDFTFYKCTSLLEAELPTAMQSVGKSAFYKCENLSEIDFSRTNTEFIEKYAFYGCKSLRGVSFNKNDLTDIQDYAFYKCSKLGAVTLPDSVKTLGSRAFGQCESLTTLVIGQGVETIGDYAFTGCAALEGVIIPDSVKTLGKSAFYKCAAVKTLVIGQGVETIGDYAFYGMSSVETLRLPANVKEVGKYAFKGCSALKSVTIPQTLEIGAHVFYGCTGLTVYTDAETTPDHWHHRWNTSYRPTLFGCGLSEDGTYVETFTVTKNSIANATAEGGVFAPEREGYEFVGWATKQGGEAVYAANGLAEVSEGTKLYAVWKEIPTENLPEGQE